MATHKIEWLHRTNYLGSEEIEGDETSGIVHEARGRAAEAAKRYPGREPDSFRLMDGSGAEVGAFSVSDKAYDGTT